MVLVGGAALRLDGLSYLFSHGGEEDGWMKCVSRGGKGMGREANVGGVGQRSEEMEIFELIRLI